MGPTDLDAPVGDVAESLAQRRLDLLDRSQLRFLAALLALHADQDVVGLAERLQGHFAQAQTAEQRAHRPEVGGRARYPRLDQQAAAKIDPEVQALERHQDQGEEDQRSRECIPPVLVAHEMNVGAIGNEAEGAHRLRASDR